MYGLLVAGLYLVVVAACSVAAGTAKNRRPDQADFRIWLSVLGLFVILFASRAFDGEETLRRILRSVMRDEGAYEARRDVQRPLAAAMIFIFSVIGLWVGYRFVRFGRGKRRLAIAVAVLSALAMLALVVLRIVSLHQIDKVLYGPMKLNWLIDVGSSLAVIGAAICYVGLLLPRK